MVNFALDIVVGFFVVYDGWRTSGYEGYIIYFMSGIELYCIAVISTLSKIFVLC